MPLAGGVFLQILRAAVLSHPHGKAEVEVVIGNEAGKAIVAGNQGTLCGGQVNAVNIVKLGVAVVETDQELAGVFGTDLLDLGVDVVQRGQVKDGVGFQMDGVKTPVFIAAGVLQVDEVGVGVGPAVKADAAAGIAGDRAGGGRVVSRGDPNIQHAVQGGEPAEVRAVRADLDGGFVGVTEKELTGDKGRKLPGGGRRHSYGSCS